MVGVSPSGSVAVAEQVRLVVVVTPLAGEMEAAEVKEGSVLPRLTDALSLSVPPWASVAVAVQVMVSPGETSLELTV